ncbi:hypothetical protein DH2020_024344 [Rehmannia glutinosa]|uniref:Late embryogenesis abundant protein LEA-2 subgroup domain-containing protein n=1 Tax=Rehmannia glutinosa TaxID=99300 RepID=A0ABR0W2M6_REHGL
MEDPNRPVTGYPAPNPNGYSANPPPSGTAYPYAAGALLPTPTTITKTTPTTNQTPTPSAAPPCSAASWPYSPVPSRLVLRLNFTIGNNSLISFTSQVRLTARNPNKKITLSYDHIDAVVFYRSSSLSDTVVPPFSQDTKSETSLTANFAAVGAFVDQLAVNGINSERGSRGTVGFNLRMLSRVRFKAKAWRTRHRITFEKVSLCLFVNCFERIAVSLASERGELLSLTLYLFEMAEKQEWFSLEYWMLLSNFSVVFLDLLAGIPIS